jgi:Xaa-Pro aminopeptidase
MHSAKTKSLQSIEEKMQNLDKGSLRYHILENAKNFKTSWIELGRSLYTALKDKLYKEWGYSSFDIYTAKEIGIRKQTAMKLLKSYYFLEKEEPMYLKDDYVQSQGPAAIPSFESVDVLRMAKSKKLDEGDYATLKEQVFEKGRDAREVKKDLTALIRQRQELDPEEARKIKKVAAVRRFLSTLKALKQELEIAKLLPAALLKEAESLIKKIEAEI